MSYLVGELHRKLGDHAKARAWLEPLLEKEIPDGLKTWVTEAIAKSKAATKD